MDVAGNGYLLTLSDDEVARYRLMADHARASEADLWQRAGLVAGARVADVGCGPGALLSAWAEAVGPAGQVTALDADPQAVATAGGLIAAHGLRQVTVRQGRADRTGLPPGSFDVVMLRHVLAHNGGAEDTIVGHLATLLRPGGCLYLVDVDVTAGRFLPEDADVVDLFDRYAGFHTSLGNDMRAGLRLGERLARAGLDVIEFSGRYAITPVPPGMRGPAWAAREALLTAGFATVDDLARWDAAYARLDRAEPRPTMFMPAFTAIGQRAAATA
ncbi:MAG TPA: methyltransferase domain-containing protein [Jatrophihabitantaceae bacterium]|jgi:SAM-dependent methyltransferase